MTPRVLMPGFDSARKDDMRTHWSKDPIIQLRTIEQDPDEYFKPRGLWYSVDGDWERWCEAEEFGDLGSKVRHELTLADENILKLASPADILAFHERYGKLLAHLMRDAYPDWKRLADDYDGIEIAPYQWDLRLDPRVRWYYAWDCASGCLWRPRGAQIVPNGDKS